MVIKANKGKLEKPAIKQTTKPKKKERKHVTIIKR